MSSHAHRQRSYRQRQKAGRIAVLVEVDETALVDRLVSDDFLDWHTENRDEIEHALRRMLAVYIGG